MYFIRVGVTGRFGIVADWSVGHERSNDMGQLSGMAEVDGMRCPLDHDQHHFAVLLLRDLLNSSRSRHEWIAVSDYDQRRDVQREEAFQRRILREGLEKAQCARHSETEVVRSSNWKQTSGLANAVVRKLADGTPQRLVVHTAGGGNENCPS